MKVLFFKALLQESESISLGTTIQTCKKNNNNLLFFAGIFAVGSQFFAVVTLLDKNSHDLSLSRSVQVGTWSLQIVT